jgi:hypothetical protein
MKSVKPIDIVAIKNCLTMTAGRGAGGADYYVVPHSTIPSAQIRHMDAFILLGLGALWVKFLVVCALMPKRLTIV